MKVIESIGDLQEDDRELVVSTLQNLGLDQIFAKYPKETTSISQLMYVAWEYMADGLGENEGHKALIDELNHMQEFLKED